MERRSYEKDGFVYLLDDNQTAWIREGSTDGQRSYRLPESIDVAGKSYVITDTDIGAFCDEPNLEELIVPDCYKYIDEDSFRGCAKLSRVHLGRGIKWFHQWTFAESQNVKILLDPNNPYLKTSDDGTMIVSSDGKTLIAVIDRNVRVLDVPEGIETIAPIAISCLTELEELTLPLSLKEIDGNGIMDCHKLKELVIPENVTETGFQCVEWCEKFETITIPSHLQSISDALKEDNPSLKYVILSDSKSR